jgi:hypothetical protein
MPKPRTKLRRRLAEVRNRLRLMNLSLNDTFEVCLKSRDKDILKDQRRSRKSKQ